MSFKIRFLGFWNFKYNGMKVYRSLSVENSKPSSLQTEPRFSLLISFQSAWTLHLSVMHFWTCFYFRLHASSQCINSSSSNLIAPAPNLEMHLGSVTPHTEKLEPSFSHPSLNFIWTWQRYTGMSSGRCIVAKGIRSQRWLLQLIREHSSTRESSSCFGGLGCYLFSEPTLVLHLACGCHVLYRICLRGFIPRQLFKLCNEPLNH